MKNRATITVNPFVSEAQRRACRAAGDPRWDCDEWEAETRGKLPKRKRVANAGAGKLLRIDPTRTTTLRRAFAVKIRAAFARLKADIVKLVQDENAFGIRPIVNAFCPTGKGGGVDPSCSSGSVKSAAKDFNDLVQEQHKLIRDGKVHPRVAEGTIELAKGPFLTMVESRVIKVLLKVKRAYKDAGKSGFHYVKDEVQTAVDRFRDALTARGKDAIVDSKREDREVNVKELMDSLKFLGSQLAWARDGIKTIVAHRPVVNAFCPTGKGGGVDPTCSPTRVFHGTDAEFVDKIRREGLKISESGKSFGKLSAAGHVYVASDRGEAEFWGKYGKSPTGGRRRRYAIIEIHVPPDQLHRFSSDENAEKIPGIGKSTASKFSGDIPPEWIMNVTIYGNSSKRVRTLNSETAVNMRYVVVRLGLRVVSLNARFDFPSDPEKLNAFKEWVKKQARSRIAGKPERELWDSYIKAVYRKGGGRAFDDAKAAEASTGKRDFDFYRGSKEDFLKSAFGRPASVERVKLLAERAFGELDNVTEDMATRMSRTLVEGLIRGDSPLALAKEMSDDLDISEARAETIARTELIRAHAEGQLDAMAHMGIDEVSAAVEWSTAGDERVCPLCKPLEGIVLTLGEARGMIPRHPNCRCAWLPVVGESPGQITAKEKIEEAIEISARLGDDDFGPGEEIAEERVPLYSADISKKGSETDK